MKKHYLWLFVLFMTWQIQAQVNLYTYATGTSGTLDPMTGSTQLVAASSDDGISSVTPITFSFTFAGPNYTQFSANANGLLRLGATAITSGSTSYTNTAANAGSQNPAIMPYWDDLATGVGGKVHYVVTGSAPNRKLIVEWFVTVPRATAGTAAAKFQCSLAEGTNVVEFTYGSGMVANTANSGATIGLATSSTVYNNVVVSTNTNSTSTFTTTNTAAITAGRTYTFTPPVFSPCVTPTALASANVYSAVTTTGLTGTFTAASPAPSKYLVVRSTSATPPTPVNGTNYAIGDATLGAGTNVRLSANALTFSDSGLSAGTLYYYHIFSYNDACTGQPFYSTSAYTSSQATVCATGTSVASNSVTSGGANITWTGAGNYILEYGATGFTPGTGATAGVGGTIASSTATTPYALSGLSPNTAYSIYVRQVCPLGGYSANSTVLSLTTACAAITTFPSVNNFATYPGACWLEGKNGTLAAGPTTVSTSASLWEADGWLNSGSTGAAKMNVYSLSRIEWLISPYYTLPAGMRLTYNAAALQFAATTAPTTAWEADDVVDLVYSVDNVNWTVLKSYNSTNVPSHLGQLEVVDLSGFSGQTLHFAFRMAEGATDGSADIDFIIDNFTVEAIPVLPPNCASGFVPADVATNVVRNPTLSWTAATGSPLSYDVYFGTTPTPPLATNTTGLTYAPALLTANSTYYWKIVPKNANGDATGCTTQSFQTGTGLLYCTSLPTSNDNSGITSVVLGATNVPVTDVTYVDNTATVIPFTQGANSNVQITFATGYTYDTNIWIDFNDDGDFTDSGELVKTVIATVSTNPNTMDASFTMPIEATGPHRMRIGTADVGQVPPAPCYSGTFGVTLDFTVNVLPQPTDTPDYVGLQFPASATILAGNTATTYGQVYEGGLTDVSPNITGQAPGIEAWVGVNATNTNPNTWLAGAWSAATWNSGNVSNNDEYQANIGSGLVPGTYYYAYRFRLNGGPYVYGGTDGTNGNFWNGTTHNSGVLTVNPNPTQCATMTTPANAATNVTVGTVALNWTAPATGPTPTGYKVYFGTTAGTTTLVTTTAAGVLTYNASAPTFSTTYYWRIVPTSTIGGDATGCTEFSFTTQPDPFAPYCSAVSYTSGVEPITSVVFAGINNQSPAGVLTVANGGVSLQNFISITGNVTTETAYPMALKGNTDGASFTNNFRVFIDWNHDGDFGDAGESISGGSITGSTGVDAIVANTTITVPATALAGATRMRIKKLYSADTGDVTLPCAGGQYGQSEDYTLNVTLCTPTTWYADADGDLFGNPAVTQSACNQPVGYVANNTDCDDTNININATFPFYVDADNDTYGTGSLVQVCAVNGTTPPTGYSVNNTDCNDTNPAVHQTFPFYVDADGDTYGTGSLVQVCAANGTTAPAGYSLNDTDCNDSNNAVWQSASLYVDADSDGYTSGTQETVCYGAAIPAGYLAALTAIDCNDNVAAIHPNAAEIPYNGVDDDCDNVIDETGTVTTTLTAASCGTTLTSIGSIIGIQTLAGHTITGYRIRATNGAQVQVIEKNVPNFTMTQFASYAYATTYTIDIQLQRAGVWQASWGTTCLVSTPAILEEGGAGSVNPSQCGITLAKINTLIATTSLPGVTGYRFRVTNLTDSVGPNPVQTIDRSQNWFSLQMLTRHNYATLYRIEVAVKTTGTYGGYGAPCEVYSPNAPSLVNCGGTVALKTTAVACTSETGVTQYRFQVTRQSDNASATIDRAQNWFNFNMVPAAAYTVGAMYTVRVAVMTAGTWSPYGDACEIQAPTGTGKGVPATAVAAPSVDFKVAAFPNPFTADFNIDMTTSSQETVELKVYDMLGKLIESKQVNVSDLNAEKVGAQYPSGVYNVIVNQDGVAKTLRVIKR